MTVGFGPNCTCWSVSAGGQAHCIEHGPRAEMERVTGHGRFHAVPPQDEPMEEPHVARIRTIKALAEALVNNLEDPAAHWTLRWEGNSLVVTDVVRLHALLTEQLGIGQPRLDLVEHPRHYTQHPSGLECWDVNGSFPANVGAAIKYLWRSGLKGDAAAQELLKAHQYLQRELKAPRLTYPEMLLRMGRVIGASPKESLLSRVLDEMRVFAVEQEELEQAQVNALINALVMIEQALDDAGVAFKPWNGDE